MTGSAPGDGAPQPTEPALTYPGAPESVIARWMARRDPVTYGRGEALLPLDVDLAALGRTLIPLEEADPDGRSSPYQRQIWRLRRELAGKSELALLNANLIVHLRRAFYPDHTPALFLRIWKEHGPALMAELPGRWLISSVITFGDVGETEAQRRIGLALNVLFSAMKLYEVERTFSGHPAHALFRRPRMASKILPLGMSHFGFRNGGLDYNLLAPIWKEALAEPVCGPLACHLLDRLNADPGNIFRRIRQMSAIRQPRSPDGADADAEEFAPGAPLDDGQA